MPGRTRARSDTNTSTAETLSVQQNLKSQGQAALERRQSQAPVFGKGITNIIFMGTMFVYDACSIATTARKKKQVF